MIVLLPIVLLLLAVALRDIIRYMVSSQPHIAAIMDQRRRK